VEPRALVEMGFSLAAYPFDLLVPSIQAMSLALGRIKKNSRAAFSTDELDQLWRIAGFRDYAKLEEERFGGGTTTR
jgi:hypothetical protein